jgi:uncharacterized protein
MNADDVATYLRENPEFFRHRAGLFTDMLLPDPHEGRAVSLTERQSALLRERVRALEVRLDELMQIGRDNDHLARVLVDWTAALLHCDDRLTRRQVAIEKMQALFGIPVVSVRTWGASPAPEYAELASFVHTLNGPTCSSDFPVHLLGDINSDWAEVRSSAWIPLTQYVPNQSEPSTLGVLVLGSPHAIRFDSNLGTAVLSRIGELASAALLADIPTTHLSEQP